MKRLIAGVLLMGLSSAWAETVVLECEQFANHGGWSVDSQFIDEMGSSYLLAHGLGHPVADASTTFEVKKGGEYAIWVRTMDWTAKWAKQGSAGKFQLEIEVLSMRNRSPWLSEPMGTDGNSSWHWQKAGVRKFAANTRYFLRLKDLTGFDGRCDAIVVTTEKSESPDKLYTLSTSTRPTATTDCHADLVVAGGGIAGICTAISAARLGLKVALVQDRPVLGGANSSEVRVHLGGYQNLGPYPRLGDVVAEIGPAKGGNAQPAERYEDDRKMAAVKAEKNITLVLNCRVVGAETAPRPETACGTAQGRILAVIGRDVVTGARTRFVAPLFVDCTGDGCVGALAGADWRLGRESKAETGEKDAVDVADKQILGASCQWYAVRNAKVEKRGGGGEDTVVFPNEPWMIRFNEEAVDYTLHGDWNWETGMFRDQLNDFETVRDYAMLVAYSNWNHVKNIGPRKNEFADAELAWVAYVAGKRETRRLMGDHILTYDDVFEERPYPDGTCCTTWAIDLHYPMPANQRNYDGEPFRSICTHDKHYPYPIPYRCFYSRNVPNLFMAGRDISVTHVALGTTRVMRTHGMMGEVVGMAASICKKHGCDPRGVYTDHLDELKALMTKGVGLGKKQPPQTYNQGSCKFSELSSRL